jgi:hypothetical protein
MIRQNLKKPLLLLLIFLLFTSSVVIGQRFVGPVVTKRVKLERGRTTAIIKGIARTPGTHEYVLKVRSGQTMTVHLTSSNNGVEFSVETPNGDWTEGGLGVKDWSGELGFSGDYKILVTNNRSRVQRNPRYTLEVSVR